MDKMVEVAAYPRNMSMFWSAHGIPEHVDAVFVNGSGKLARCKHKYAPCTVYGGRGHRDPTNTYFFVGTQVYEYDNFYSRVSRGYPKHVSEFWPACRHTADLRRHHQHVTSASTTFTANGFLALCCLYTVITALFALPHNHHPIHPTSNDHTS
jgi:hypothetical protein